VRGIALNYAGSISSETIQAGWYFRNGTSASQLVIHVDDMKHFYSVACSFRLLAAIVVTWGLVGSCYPVRSKGAAIGIFELKGKAGAIRLEISPAGTFTETVLDGSGQVQKLEGSWTWSDGRVGFDGLWIPKAFAPDSFVKADAAAPVGTFRYTEPGHWVVTTEKHWGTVVLPIFPDWDIEFKKVADLDRP
jgi:hypothetical protein